MRTNAEATQKPLGNADLALTLSPLLLFVAHVVYLIFWSPDPFLNKWLDGSFSFFVSLVLCNIMRAKVVARTAGAESENSPEEDEADAGGEPAPREGGTPGNGQSRP